MTPRNCRACYYRHEVCVGSVELSARCDHPDIPEDENRELTPTEFQAPEWCPLGENPAQPIKRGYLHVPLAPEVHEVPGLSEALGDWYARGNFSHENKPDPRWYPACVHEGDPCECRCHTEPILHDQACCTVCLRCKYREVARKS